MQQKNNDDGDLWDTKMNEERQGCERWMMMLETREKGEALMKTKTQKLKLS